HARQWRVYERERRIIKRFAAAHPSVARTYIPAMPNDVHDLDGLRDIGALLTADSASLCLSHWACTRTGFHFQMWARLRKSDRRSRSVMPPQTPHSIRLSSASARHWARTGQAMHTDLALFCAAPRTNKSTGSVAHNA